MKFGLAPAIKKTFTADVFSLKEVMLDLFAG
jgi:hypothetical protein